MMFIKTGKECGALLLAVFAVALFAGCATTGGVKPGGAKAQNVQAVLDRWVEALGGRPLLEKLAGMEVRATVELAAGGKFEIHTWQTAEDLYRSELRFQNGASLIEAYDGKIAWRKSSLWGFGFVPRAELETTLRRDSIHAALTAPQDYHERRLLPDAPVQGRPCHVLSMVARNAVPERWFFDAETGRMLRIERGPAETPELVETLEFSDYRDVGGMMLSFGQTFKGAKNSYTVRRIEILPNPLVGRSLWAAPAEALREGLKVAGILDRYMESAGGAAALARVRTRVTEQEIEQLSAGVKYRMKLSQKIPNQVLVEESLPGMGQVTQGYDGATAWINSDIQGYRVLKGAELRQVVDNADLRTGFMLAERCPLRRLIGPRDVNGQGTQAVALATMQGPAGIYYFSEADGRLVRVESGITAGAQGMLPVTFDYSDFRAVDGLVLPFLTTATNPAVKSVTRVLSVTHNVPLADSIFKPRKDQL